MPDDRLSQQQKEAIAQLRSGLSTSNIALALGVPESTVADWFDSDEVFRSAYDRARTAMLEQKFALLISATENAVNFLTATIDNPKVHIRFRLKSAEVLLNAIAKARQDDYEARIFKLEQVAASKSSSAGSG